MVERASSVKSVLLSVGLRRVDYAWACSAPSGRILVHVVQALIRQYLDGLPRLEDFHTFDRKPDAAELLEIIQDSYTLEVRLQIQLQDTRSHRCCSFCMTELLPKSGQESAFLDLSEKSFGFAGWQEGFFAR